MTGTAGTLFLLLYAEPGAEPRKPLGALGAETTQTDDALGRMASKHGDPKAATAAANDLAWKQTF